MNKSQTYGVVAIVIVAALVVAAPFIVRKPAAPGENTATVVQSVNVGNTQTINWTPSNYPSATVSISIIKKTGDNPSRYQLVRVSEASTPNDGSTTWVPTPSDLGTDVYIQIGCVNAKAACQATISPAALSVK